MEINMDFTTIQKTFETQSKILADAVQPKELKEIQITTTLQILYCQKL